MAIKVKAVERQLKVGKDAGSFRFMLQAEIYNTLSAQKVISEAAVRSGIPEGALRGHRRSLHRHTWIGTHAIRRSCYHGG